MMAAMWWLDVGFALVSWLVMAALPLLATFLATERARFRQQMGMDPIRVVYSLQRFVRFEKLVYFPMFMLVDLGTAFVISIMLTGAFSCLPDLSWGTLGWLYPMVLLLWLGLAVIGYGAYHAGYALITGPLLQRLRGLAVSRTGAVWHTFRWETMWALPYATVYFLMLLPGFHWANRHPWSVVAIIVGFMSLLSALLPMVLPVILRAKRLAADAIPAEWREVSRQAGLPGVRFYVWPTHRFKVANALALGLWQPAIVVSDYLLDHLPPAQAQSVIAHELGHLRYRHAWRIQGFGLTWPAGWATLQTALGSAHPLSGWGGLLLFLLLLPAWYLLFQYVLRTLEYQADGFCTRVGLQADTCAQALEKINDLNQAFPRELPFWDEWTLSHPSIANRVRRLQANASA